MNEGVPTILQVINERFALTSNGRILDFATGDIYEKQYILKVSEEDDSDIEDLPEEQYLKEWQEGEPVEVKVGRSEASEYKEQLREQIVEHIAAGLTETGMDKYWNAMDLAGLLVDKPLIDAVVGLSNTPEQETK